ncbi:MAG: AMP-binding protein [Desulfotomaculaceae bacterium]|nr:AMP-binding protein [Desulfotomaculaceae bacterium]
MNIVDLITRNAEYYPNRRAIICGDDGREFTWAEYNKLINQFGNGLIKMGVQKGDRVGIYPAQQSRMAYSLFWYNENWCCSVTI